VGGVARRATVIRQEREKAGQNILVLDAGAALANDFDPAKRTHGQTSVQVMNLMGYNAMALGLLDVSSIGLDELRTRMTEARFPMLSANLYVAGTKQLVTKPYIVLEMADHRVGILGLTEAGATPEVTAADPLRAARDRLPELQRQADIIIVLSHAGAEMDWQIAEQLPGIDMLISGGNQTPDPPTVVQTTGTLLVHADAASPGNAGRNVGVGYLTFDRSGRLQKHEWRRAVLDDAFADDPEISAWLKNIPPAQ
jgi:5'-nucleotidase / UDP-sugar diphosphatase